MLARIGTPAASISVDLLEQFIGAARPRLAGETSPKAQLELLWSYAKASRDFASEDVWRAQFNALAAELGLTAHRRIKQDGIDHILRWAWRGWNPFR
jgi:hypothetical protein